MRLAPPGSRCEEVDGPGKPVKYPDPCRPTDEEEDWADCADDLTGSLGASSDPPRDWEVFWPYVP